MSGTSSVHTHSPAGADKALGQSASTPSTPLGKRQKRKLKLKEKLQAMEQLDTLVHRRGIAKGKVTKIFNACQAALTEAQVKVYSRKLEAAYQEYQSIHDQILGLVSADEREPHDSHFEVFDSLYDEVSIILEEQTSRFNPNIQVANANASQLQAVAVPQAPVVVQQPLRMPIPSFDGRYESWPKFKAMFKDLVDKGPDPPAVKLYHLDKSLVGSAAGLIDAKTINEGNYAHAWQMLEERYENKRHSIDTHIHGLLNFKRMTKENYSELRNLVDECSKHVESLKYLGQEFSGVSEQIVVHLLAAALDKDTRRHWESTIVHGELPNYTDTLKFLKDQCFVLERCESSKSSQPQSKMMMPAKPIHQKSLAVTTNASEIKCDFCGKGHLNFTCSEFKSLSVLQRLGKVREKNVCFNCLRKGHRGKNCPSDKTCAKCQRNHHSLLHLEDKQISKHEDLQVKPEPTQVKEESKAPTQSQVTTATCSSAKATPLQQVLLLTAIVDVIDKKNRPHPCRVLLDSGSQANLVSRTMANMLGLKQRPSNVIVAGINDIKSRLSSSCIVEVHSRYSQFGANISCLVTDKVTADLPTSSVDMSTLNLPRGVRLADPQFYQSGKIDMILGNQWFLKLLLPGELSLADNLPSLRETQFGWVVGGICDANTTADQLVHSHSVTLEDLNASIKKFWEIEEVQIAPKFCTEEQECEQHFLATHRRDSTGRYIVQLPLRNTLGELGDSRPMALRRFYAMERRFAHQPELKKQYAEFMAEYEDLGHCREINENDDKPGTAIWYLPHHAVLKPSNTTTKCRVVFDASAKVAGCSLNDVLKVGAINQSDLQSIVLRFREPRYVMSADITKMYRQILVDDCHTPLQRVLWRKDPSCRLRVLELTTVTYGTASAPFLATRALQQLAIDERKTYPIAADVIERDCYVDNALFGFNELSNASVAQDQLIQLLAAGGFHLHKWSSNSTKLLETIPEKDREELVCIGMNEAVKTLGLMWNPALDELMFSAMPLFDPQEPTKRHLLSVIARMYDPLGLVAPVVVIGKLLMQKIWKAKLDWDEVITGELKNEYEFFLKAISGVSQLRIPRQAVMFGSTAFELHGFADASQCAYGACIFIRSVIAGRGAIVKLLCAKSKIVPKNVLTIPRKELLAAGLLYRLVKMVLSALNTTFDEITLWSDSQIVLAWLQKNPSRLDVYVANRVREITASADRFRWRYVNTNENPADLVSRGLSAGKLMESDLWWNGPRFLRNEMYDMISPDPLGDEDIPELKRVVTVHAVIALEMLPVFSKYESFRKLQRVLAFVLRFCRNCTEKMKAKRVLQQYPTVMEMRSAMTTIIRVLQHHTLADEIVRVSAGKPCKRIANLCPILDDGLLRVGGRLRHSSLTNESKHQWILPSRNPIVESYITAVHRENLHVGPSALMAIVRRQFWVLNPRSTFRKVTRRCVTCFRTNPITANQFMGDLPESRCDRAPAFQKVGIDFAGPILIRQTGRKAAPVKGYICVFVCLVTKGLHLEAVENLSTEAFMGALVRFVSRRGLPEDVYSDNGTNFIGAKHELRELYHLFKQQQTERKIYEFCESRQIRWRTIPPSAPHMGGLWEAGVKSTKAVLKKVCKSALLTMVEFSTLLCQIEALLNSRPLYASSDDPADLEPLTPGHFLIDRPLNAIPEPTYDKIPRNRLSRWQYVQHLREMFWKRWYCEYLMELQTRGKWTRKYVNLRKGMIVLVKDDNLPPQFWKMGRVECTYPGSDNMVRMVELRTKAGVLMRPIHKLAPLPILDNHESSDNENDRSPGENVRADCTSSK